MYLAASHPWAPTIFARRLDITIFDSFVSLDINLNNFPLLSWINVFKLSVEIFTILILNQFQLAQRNMKTVSQNNLSTRIPAWGTAIKPLAPVMERLLALEVLERPELISDAGREHPAPAWGVHLNLWKCQLCHGEAHVNDQVLHLFVIVMVVVHIIIVILPSLERVTAAKGYQIDKSFLVRESRSHWHFVKPLCSSIVPESTISE